MKQYDISEKSVEIRGKETCTFYYYSHVTKDVTSIYSIVI
jgi:hypothetical protein